MSESCPQMVGDVLNFLQKEKASSILLSCPNNQELHGRGGRGDPTP